MGQNKKHKEGTSTGVLGCQSAFCRRLKVAFLYEVAQSCILHEPKVAFCMKLCLSECA